MKRPLTPETLRKNQRMSPKDRAKIFTPFAALRGHSERLGEENVKLMRCERVELSEDEAQRLSDKLSQVRKGMDVTVTYFQADEDGGDVGYYVTVTGVVKSVDLVYRELMIDYLGIWVEDVLDVSGEGDL